MWTRVQEIEGRLSPAEKTSLTALGAGRETIPFRHIGRLITLGLAELSMGRLDLTIPGRQVLGLMGAGEANRRLA